MSITSLRVTSDIIGSSYTNGATENVTYSFFPNVGHGYKIVEKLLNPVYLLITLSTISSLETTLADQMENWLTYEGEELSIRLVIREAY